MTDDPARPPRFPYVAALLCVACLGAAVWMWMRYSYARPTTAENVKRDFMALMESETAAAVSEGRRWGNSKELSRFAALPQPYLAVRGIITVSAVGLDGLVHGAFDCRYFNVVLPADAAVPYPGVERTYVGRLRYCVVARPAAFRVVLDTTASRLTGATIAGLVVGAMGAFVFVVAFRHWLREWRKFREEARA